MRCARSCTHITQGYTRRAGDPAVFWSHSRKSITIASDWNLTGLKQPCPQQQNGRKCGNLSVLRNWRKSQNQNQIFGSSFSCFLFHCFLPFNKANVHHEIPIPIFRYRSGQPSMAPLGLATSCLCRNRTVSLRGVGPSLSRDSESWRCDLDHPSAYCRPWAN